MGEASQRTLAHASCELCGDPATSLLSTSAAPSLQMSFQLICDVEDLEAGGGRRGGLMVDARLERVTAERSGAAAAAGGGAAVAPTEARTASFCREEVSGRAVA